MRFRLRFIAFLVLGAVALLAAGCGGGDPSAAVANLGSSATTTTSDSGPSGSVGTSSGSGGGTSLTMKTQNGAKFAACMRSHGVPNFPDPSGDGSITFGSGSGIDPSSPKFQKASDTCRKLLPSGGQPSPQQQAKAQQQMLAFSACMRSHGVPDFPDPTFSGGHISMQIKGGPGSDLDPSSPKFKAAQEACKGNLPGRGKGLPGGGPSTNK